MFEGYLFLGLLILGLFGFIVLRILIEADVSDIVLAVVAAISIILFIGGFVGAIILRLKPQPLDEQYQEKISAIETAEKELQKFLIDHPEFKE